MKKMKGKYSLTFGTVIVALLMISSTTTVTTALFKDEEVEDAYLKEDFLYLTNGGVTINAGSITIDLHADPRIKINVRNNYNVDVGYGGWVTVEVDYEINCPGTADDGEADIRFTDGKGDPSSDNVKTGEYKKGVLRIKRYCNPLDSFKIKLYARLTDWWGLNVWESTGYSEVTIRRAPKSIMDVWPGKFTTDGDPGEYITCTAIEVKNIGDAPLNWHISGITGDLKDGWTISPKSGTNRPPDSVTEVSISGRLPRSTLQNPYPSVDGTITFVNDDDPSNKATVHASFQVRANTDNIRADDETYYTHPKL